MRKDLTFAPSSVKSVSVIVSIWLDWFQSVWICLNTFESWWNGWCAPCVHTGTRAHSIQLRIWNIYVKIGIMIWLSQVPQKWGTFMLVPQVPQMRYKWGTKKQPHMFFLDIFIIIQMMSFKMALSRAKASTSFKMGSKWLSSPKIITDS